MRRVLAAILGAVLVLAIVAGAILFLQSRDSAGVAPPAAATGPGEPVPGRCPAHPAVVTHDARQLSRDQLLQAVALGNVVLYYDAGRPPGALLELQRGLTGRYDAELGAAGLAVVLARRRGTRGVVALAWRHRLTVASAADKRLRDFAEVWLGVGAPRPCRDTT